MEYAASLPQRLPQITRTRVLHSAPTCASMLCTLLLPDLFLPRAVHGDACRGLSLPALERLLARADRVTLPQQSYESWLCQAFGVAPQPDWPVAPLTHHLDGADTKSGFWLRADPVHLRTTRERVVLLDASVLAIQPEEATTLVAALNAYFADDTRQFFTPHPERWYLRLASHPQIATRSLLDAIGNDVSPLLPAGPQALHWHRVMNEIQMLLHAHPANDAREQRGAPTLNSLWLWGGGSWPEVASAPFQAVWSSDALGCALAQCAGLTPRSVDSAAQWLEAAALQGREKHHLIVLDRLLMPAHHGDLPLWREHLLSLENAWLAPMLRALRERSVDRLSIVAIGMDACMRFEITPRKLVRFWRVPLALSSYNTTRDA